MKHIKSVTELDLQNDQEFEYDDTFYKVDIELKDILNKMFSAKIKHVFSSKSTFKVQGSVGFDNTSFICVNEEGEFIFITSS